MSLLENLTEFRKKIIANEEIIYNPHAAFSKEHSRRHELEEDHRLPYKRDVDRIIHSKAYSRYIDKTQVVYLIQKDHLTKRSLHVQLVSNFARGIAEILRLNIDLVEAIALSHDVGHPPFGHEGELYLGVLSKEYGEGSFSHPWQSCRLFSMIEPLNLGLAVYDGILCHDGGMQENTLHPLFGKTWEDHRDDLEKKLNDSDLNIVPATLEGCLVKICDTMSYLGRDIEDAISLGIITRDEVPETHLGKMNRDILSHLARDVIYNSYGKDYISFSVETLEALSVLRKFNFEKIYVHKKLKVESHKIERSYRILFEFLLKDYLDKDEKSYLYLHFLHNKPQAYREYLSPARAVIDFISGMTDNYFVKTLENVVIPKRIEWEIG